MHKKAPAAIFSKVLSLIFILIFTTLKRNFTAILVKDMTTNLYARKSGNRCSEIYATAHIRLS